MYNLSDNYIRGKSCARFRLSSHELKDRPGGKKIEKRRSVVRTPAARTANGKRTS